MIEIAKHKMPAVMEAKPPDVAARFNGSFHFLFTLAS
jgi:hypothetical protein